MKLAACAVCGRLLQFEHAACRGCGAPLGFSPGRLELLAVDAGEDGTVVAPARPGEAFRRCVNAEANGCNWLVAADDRERRCVACRLNRNLADMSVALHRDKWRLLECAKRRLIYAMLRLGQPVAAKDGEERGLAFDFLIGSRGAPVMTGHANGLITINLLEADSVERERQRIALGEPYRTLLGHFRHEAGHFYEDVLVGSAGRQRDAFRALFGDESESYSDALEAYYADGPRADWQEAFVTAYATMHPWEDFAETWAHYLHMVDTLDTGAGFGLSVNPRIGADPRDAAAIDFDPYDPPAFADLVAAWLPLTEAVNSLNRSMGQPDLYPFDLTPKVVEKLGFIHGLLHPGRE